jgi:hypothetical protein
MLVHDMTDSLFEMLRNVDSKVANGEKVSPKQKINAVRSISDFVKKAAEMMPEIYSSSGGVSDGLVATGQAALEGSATFLLEIVDLMRSSATTQKSVNGEPLLEDHGDEEQDANLSVAAPQFQRRTKEDTFSKTHHGKKEDQKRRRRFAAKEGDYHFRHLKESNPQHAHLYEMQEAMVQGDERKLNKVMRSFKKRLDRHVGRRTSGFGQRRTQDDKNRDLTDAGDESKAAQCQLLAECVLKMSLYDIFVYFLSDDIDTESGDITEDDIENIFQFDEGRDSNLIIKKNKIMDQAHLAEENPSDINCDSLLQLFHRQIEFEGNTVIHWEGGMVNQVCLAEGTTVFVDFESIERVAGKDVANVVFAELISCAVELFYNRPTDEGSGYEDESNPFIDEGQGKVRLPIAYNLDSDGPRDEHGQLHSNSGEAYDFSTLSLSMAAFRVHDRDDDEDDFYRFFDDGKANCDSVEANCEASIATFYHAILLKAVTEGDITVVYPAVFINVEYKSFSHAGFGVIVEYELSLGVTSEIEGIANPECGCNSQSTWQWEDSNTTPQCVKDFEGLSGGTCPYYEIPEGENLFNGFTDLATVTTALELVFGDKPSIGFICGIKEAVVNDNEAMPGYCCLDAPYQLDGDQWGREVGYCPCFCTS